MKFSLPTIYLRFGHRVWVAIALCTALVLGLCMPVVARPSPVLWERSDWVTVGPRETVSLYSRCANDRVVVSGGFHSQSAAGNRGFKVIDSYAEDAWTRSEEHTSELQSLTNLVCRLLLEKKNYLPACCSVRSVC